MNFNIVCKTSFFLLVQKRVAHKLATPLQDDLYLVKIFPENFWVFLFFQGLREDLDVGVQLSEQAKVLRKYFNSHIYSILCHAASSFCFLKYNFWIYFPILGSHPFLFLFFLFAELHLLPLQFSALGFNFLHLRALVKEGEGSVKAVALN